MSNRLWRIALVSVVALGLGLALAVGLAAGPSRPAYAQGSTGIVRVAHTGADSPGCGSAATPCATIQYAIGEAAAGGEVRVAEGTYTGVQAIVAQSSSGPYTYTQVALITKTLTLRGGYSTADWSTSDPAQHATTIDAEGHGRGISIVGTGAQSVTVEGFTVTGGDYTGLGNPDTGSWVVCRRSYSDCGGGLYAREVTVAISQMVISGNIASRLTNYSDGGGLYLLNVNAGSRIWDSLIFSNTVQGGDAGGGGGVVHDSAGLTMLRTAFIGNSAQENAGGLFLEVDSPLALIEDCEFTGNTTSGANGYGGALWIGYGNFLLKGNSFTHNVGRQGGAIYASLGPDFRLVLDGNTFISNTALGSGGGVQLGGGHLFTLTNNLLARNSASVVGGGAYVRNASQSIWNHNTIAENDRGGAKEGLVAGGAGVAVTLTNNIVVTGTLAVFADESARVVADHTLFFGNGLNTYAEDGATIQTTNEIASSAPMFAQPGAWDYHLQEGSPAIDAGAETDVRYDIDGEPRPLAGPDIGADEWWFARVFLPLALRG